MWKGLPVGCFGPSTSRTPIHIHVLPRSLAGLPLRWRGRFTKAGNQEAKNPHVMSRIPGRPPSGRGGPCPSTPEWANPMGGTPGPAPSAPWVPAHKKTPPDDGLAEGFQIGLDGPAPWPRPLSIAASPTSRPMGASPHYKRDPYCSRWTNFFSQVFLKNSGGGDRLALGEAPG